jgi:purine-binding chemotaxis protein CheW
MASSDFLSFQLGGLEYGLDFTKVQELRVLQSLERVAADGEIIEGVALSRGVIMPIVDMRVAFSGGQAPSADPYTDVIILKLPNCVMGMVVDGVTDLVSLQPAQIHALPPALAQTGYLIGLGVTESRRLILIDIDKLMSIRRVPGGARQAA